MSNDPLGEFDISTGKQSPGSGESGSQSLNMPSELLLDDPTVGEVMQGRTQSSGATSSSDFPSVESNVEELLHQTRELARQLKQKTEGRETKSTRSSSDVPDMTREELLAHLGKTEAEVEKAETEVEKMTSDVSSKIDRLSDQLEDKIGRVQRQQKRIQEDNRSLRSNLLTGASILAVVVVGLFTAILQRIGGVRDLVISNTRRIARLGAGQDSVSVASGSMGGPSSPWLLTLIVVVIGLSIIVGALWFRRSKPQNAELSSANTSGGNGKETSEENREDSFES